jgi:hypothetical protein
LLANRSIRDNFDAIVSLPPGSSGLSGGAFDWLSALVSPPAFVTVPLGAAGRLGVLARRFASALRGFAVALRGLAGAFASASRVLAARFVSLFVLILRFHGR